MFNPIYIKAESLGFGIDSDHAEGYNAAINTVNEFADKLAEATFHYIIKDDLMTKDTRIAEMLDSFGIKNPEEFVKEEKDFELVRIMKYETSKCCFENGVEPISATNQQLCLIFEDKGTFFQDRIMRELSGESFFSHIDHYFARRMEQNGLFNASINFEMSCYDFKNVCVMIDFI